MRYETRLRHWTFLRINKQQYRISHRHYTFYFPAEIGVSWGVNDIDAVVVPVNGRVFGQDGNTTLFLDIVRVHDAFLRFASGFEGARLL